jgi:hypothetical protein
LSRDDRAGHRVDHLVLDRQSRPESDGERQHGRCTTYSSTP